MKCSRPKIDKFQFIKQLFKIYERGARSGQMLVVNKSGPDPHSWRRCWRTFSLRHFREADLPEHVPHAELVTTRNRTSRMRGQLIVHARNFWSPFGSSDGSPIAGNTGLLDFRELNRICFLLCVVRVSEWVR